MNLYKYERLVFSLAIGGLLLLGLFALLHGTSQIARADPGDLFVEPGGSGTACSQANPCSLQTALDNATGGDTIYVATGVYTGTGAAVVTVTQSITIYGGWDGIATTPPVRDPALYPSTLDGENGRRGVYISGDITPTMDGFIITGGNASNAAADPGRGGGIYSDGGSPVIV
ncbi:MAG: hypothetical protein U9R05_05145, partial [Chloroflexota bacterium]|nr:hypothetical protein [Chloroflexota bacterium]